MRSRTSLFVLLLLAGLACRSPLVDLPVEKDGPRLALTVAVENHSRKLSHLWTPGKEADSPESRQAALERHRAVFEADLRAEAARRGLSLDPSAQLRLHLTITSLGEVRPKYIAWGILSGVAWGVGTGLLVHNTRLAIGLGAYELVEEGAFWIGGSMLMGRWSSPAVVEARLFREGMAKPIWEETYYVLWTRQELAAFPTDLRSRREYQLQASLRKIMGRLFHNLEAIPSFPRDIKQVPPSSPFATVSKSQGLRVTSLPPAYEGVGSLPLSVGLQQVR